MGAPDDAGLGLSGAPPIPEQGLSTVLSSWIGSGSLYEALSVPYDGREERQWTASDVRKRASRILLAVLDPTLARLPLRTSQWRNYLPATRTRSRAVQDFPFTGVAWAQSRRSFGWPPSSFIGKVSERGADMLPVQVLRWCAETLRSAWLDCVTIGADAHLASRSQLQSMIALLDLEPVASASALIPTRSDLLALRREGAPWGTIVETAHVLLAAQKSLDFLLYELLMPDPSIRWRLFHLGVFGVLLSELEKSGCRVRSTRPLSPGSSGPNYRVMTPADETLLLWFEASGVWSYLGKRSPFVEATAGIKKADRSNGADIMLLQPSERALIIECKYSWNADFVARDGYYQASAYAMEARSRLAPNVVSVVIGPESVVSEASYTDVDLGTIGTAPPSSLARIVSEFVEPG